MRNGGRLKVGVLLSGGGTNLQALIDACAAPGFPAEIALVLSNKAEAYGLERARRAGIPTTVVDHRPFPDRPSFEREIDRALADAGVECVCLAGFLRVLTEGFVERWHDRMLNIHPSLLPAYKGLETHARALADGVAIHGCTVHFVRPALDDGPLIAQAEVPVHPGDDPAMLAARVLTREHEIYPLALRLMGEGRLSVEGETCLIDGHPGPMRLRWNDAPPIGG
ncbi:phosphoribosylglycinamide formyltransferase [Marivibrio halodurans]|uniref:Phosphoribosylglycinamide formyltransferase n=1 Tax=Marivibrio halodurans TaxID=2039722 RepID=A0A8J7V2U3_9PROT|nr:phosphoribosylglycinamide formyltransferase [Marivibrio halodurans]